MTTPTSRTKVFISYSHNDKQWLERLRVHLEPLVREGLTVWDDTQIGPGSRWENEIRAALDTAKVAVLLVSADFLASDYIADTELPALLATAENEGAVILPVIVKPSRFRKTSLGRFQAVNEPSNPLVSLPEGDREEVFVKITETIEAALKPKPPGRPKREPLPTPPRRPGHTNPFDPWTPAVPPGFTGRVSLLRRLGNALEEGRSVSIVGDWRIGKSSLLATWAQQARTRGQEVRCVSGEGPGGASIGAFVEAITGLATADGADEAADGVNRWAEAVGRSVLPPLVLVDEADGLFARFDHRFFERLRGMLGRICLVLASRREIDRVCQELGRISPFLNRLELARLGLLQADAAETLIGWGESYFEAGDAALLRRWAGHHPFYLQLLGHHLVQARRDGEDGDAALDRFYVEARVRLRELWQVLEERDRRALQDGGSGLPVRRRSLRSRGLVTADGKLFSEILTEWLREEAP